MSLQTPWEARAKTDAPPEILHGITEEERSILKKESKFGITLNHHLPTFCDLCRELISIVAQINGRKDHNLEGWENCGFIHAEYRLDPSSDTWADLASLQDNNPYALPMIQQMQETCKGSATLLRHRYLSPSEAWDKQIETLALVKFTAGEICELLAPKFARKLSIKGAQIHVKDQAHYGSESLIFEARVQVAGGWERELDPRLEYMGVVNPNDPSKCYILDERGYILGVASQIGRIQYGDLEGLQKSSGRAQQRRAEIMAPIRVANANIEQEAMLVRRANAELLKPSPKSPRSTSSSSTPPANPEDLY